MHLRAVIFAVFTSFAFWADGAEPRPIFSDDEFESGKEMRHLKRRARPDFVNEPFFEEDVWVDTTKPKILPIECTRDGLFGLPDRLFGEFGPSYAERDRWAWPDRGRHITARAGIVVMARSRAAGGVLAENPANNNEAITSERFNFSFEDGNEFNLTLHELFLWPEDNYDLEIRMLNLDMEEAAQFTSFTGNQTRLRTIPPTDFPGTDDGYGSYSTEFRNFELNLKRESDNGWLTWLGGVRYIVLNEDMHLHFEDRAAVPLPDVDYDVNVTNQLLGLQLGGQLAFVRNDRWCVDVTGKFGLMNNNVDHESQLTGAAGNPTVDQTSNQVAYVMELGVMGRRVLSEHWSAYAGYDFIWLEGVAPASNQVGKTDLTNGRGIDTDASLLLQGFQFGLEFRY